MPRRGGAALQLGALVVSAALVGCSDGSGDGSTADPSPEPSDITVSCDRFDETAQRITEAQVAIYDGKDSADDLAAVDALVAELDALKTDAPEEVRTALTDLGSAFREAQRLLDGATAGDQAGLNELAGLAPALAEDSQVVTAWILDQCEQ